MIEFLYVILILEHSQVLLAYNASLDWITAAVTIWNFGVAGLMCIHWRGPLVMQQIYLVLVSALMALVLIKNVSSFVPKFMHVFFLALLLNC